MTQLGQSLLDVPYEDDQHLAEELKLVNPAEEDGQNDEKDDEAREQGMLSGDSNN